MKLHIYQVLTEGLHSIKKGPCDVYHSDDGSLILDRGNKNKRIIINEPKIYIGCGNEGPLIIHGFIKDETKYIKITFSFTLNTKGKK
jgi:hypothetical protein